MKIFNAPCRERSIKMKGQTVSSSFVSVQMNFFHFYAFFFFYGGGKGKIVWRHWWFTLENKVVSLSQPLMLSLTKTLMLWEKSWPSLPRQEPREMLGKEVPDEIRAGGWSPRAHLPVLMGWSHYFSVPLPFHWRCSFCSCTWENYGICGFIVKQFIFKGERCVGQTKNELRNLSGMS